MRYELDVDGYVKVVTFGCTTGKCTEYEGAVPSGYYTLTDWAAYACIQAYYIDSNGNLVLDIEKLEECRKREAQEAIDNAPLIRKDLYETDEVLQSQYVKAMRTGAVIILKDIKTFAPRVKITNLDTDKYGQLRIFTQGKNMMPNDAATQTIKGITFTKSASGSINVSGTATEDIEYRVSGGSATPIFALKAGYDYYLNLGGFDCELRYFDGETTAQQYIGPSGLLNLSQSIEVTEVLLKIPSGKAVATTFFPQLEYGNAFTSYTEHKCKAIDIDFERLVELVPSDSLFPSDDLVIGGIRAEYILIENGVVTIYAEGKAHSIGTGNVGLFSDYNTIYASKDATIEIVYSTQMIDVDSLEFLQGKATTTNQFKILKDGSIEAHNGYFSGGGYFTGEINVNNRFIVSENGDVTLPSNATLSWSQIKDTDNIASKTYVKGLGYQTESQVTQITKDTVTTEYVNALKITAGSVAAENITGTKITGKTIEGGSINIGSHFKVDTAGKTTITGGSIGGLEITDSAIKYGKTSINDNSTGIYLGPDGIAVGYGGSTYPAFRVKASGDMEFHGLSDITIGNIAISSSKAKFGTTAYTEIEGAQVTIGSATNGWVISTNDIKLKSSYNTYNLKDGAGSTLASLAKGSFFIQASSTRIGTSSGTLGFFSDTGAKKQSVSAITSTSSATAATVATKLNELINALKEYNLI